MKKVFIIDFIMEIISLCAIVMHFTFLPLNDSLFGIFFIFGMCNVFPLFLLFFEYIRRCSIFISDYKFFNVNKEKVEIICTKKDASYILSCDGREIEFRTNENLFGNQMFFSYIVRNIRFREISKKRPMMYLFRKRVKLKNIKLKQLVVILNGRKHVLVKNGVSRCKCTLFNKAWYWELLHGTARPLDTRLKE